MKYQVMTQDNRWQKVFTTNQLREFFNGIPQKTIIDVIDKGELLEGYYIDELVEEVENVDNDLILELTVLHNSIAKQISDLKQQNHNLLLNIRKLEKLKGLEVI